MRRYSNPTSIPKSRFDKSRGSLLWVTVLSCVNVILFMFGTSLSFPFSATLPALISGIGKAMSEDFYSNTPFILANILAFAIVALYFICYLMAKRHKAFLIVALVFFSIDSVMLLCLFAFGFDISLLIDAAFHAWVIISLSSGIRDWDKPKASLADKPVEVTISPADPLAAPREQSAAIRTQSPNGRVLLAQNCNGLEICVKRTPGCTELIVNNLVYAEIYADEETNYSLEACVLNNVITFAVSEAGIISLYVNGGMQIKEKMLLSPTSAK
ncbi:MAG: hypothetical protein FWF44_05375 [Defluviitaleaceae bacterium]|nr:hypothetical protein [Defluviitaleaceae bacterium]